VERLSELITADPSNILRPEGSRTRPIEGTGPISLRSWFMQGNMFLNLNIPENWNGTFQTVPLGARWYHNATDMIDQKSMGVAFEVGAARIVDEEIEMTDCHAIASGSASITPLASWPQNHPLGVPQSIMQASTVMDPDGMPSWL